MRKFSMVIFSLILAFAFSTAAFAEPLKVTVPGELTLAQAQKVLTAAVAKAEAIKVPVNIAVVDSGGNLKAFYRMDDAFLGSIDVSIKKAVTARYFNMSTRALGEASQVGKSLYSIEVTNGGLVLFPGGVLLVDKNNVVVGAVGVSGGTVDEDENVANAAAAVLK
ncbi:MAG: GlcG/HbpS family heme-binding protein [Desulfovibrio sp.]|uniref:GlcG/HbpS family heme-binding protein n=1 Tax=Desulfovibrio sp. 7SRBS1 TaxID=3378064 RepID=UPI003B3C94EE